MKVLILTADSNGGYPVPAVKGGAVSTLIEHLIKGNNKKQLCDMQVLSLYDAEAEKKAKEEYPNIRFIWVKVPFFLKFFDRCLFRFLQTVRKSEKAISFRSPFSLIYYIIMAKRIINSTTVDKVVIENNIPLARTIKNSKFKDDYYYHIHNVPRIDGGCREVFQNVTKYLCVSEYVAKRIQAEDSAIGSIPPEKTAVLYNCVDIELFRPIPKEDTKVRAICEKYGFKEKDCVLVFAGRLSEEKGPDVLLEAAKRLPENVKVMIIGSLLYGTNIKSPFQKKLKNLAEELEGRVIFTGYVKQTELPYYYNAADIGVFPSIWDEPAGLTNIEAMACGLPVITTDAGGIPEYAPSAIIIERTSNIVDQLVHSILNLIAEQKNVIRGAERNNIIKRHSSIDYIDRFVSLLCEK